MDRKKFIKNCGYACIGISAIGTLLQSCVSTKELSIKIIGSDITIPKLDFLKKERYLSYIILNNENLQFPIYVFRFSENKYTALYLQCTHQGNELNAYGDKLVCSAHGSEFDNLGNVTNGPAIQPLKSFPVSTNQENIIISLKKS